MIRTHAVVGAAALVLLAGCADGSMSESDGSMEALVITEGADAPAPTPRVVRPLFSDATVAANVGGSVTTPVTLKGASCTPDNVQQVVITYTIAGRQANPASFKVNTAWSYNGLGWTPSTPVTISVPARAASDAATIRAATLTLTNATNTNAGSTSFAVVPFDLVTTPQATLSLTNANVTIHVAFAECPVVNTQPVLTLPSDITAEATSSSGAAVTYLVTASDAQDGDLTSSVSCTPASGSTFPLGETTVSCSVTDNGGLTVNGSFKVKVEDTTPAAFTAFPTGTVNLVAADINGAVLDISSLGITAADFGAVSEPSTYECDYVGGTVLTIGSTTPVSCTAKDAIGNESEPSSFDVFVGLNVNPTGFLTPLRMAAPFSAHKRGSTIPHKFLPPTYADGTPATDLAGDLRLVLQQITTGTAPDALEANEYAAGSTAWRWDAEDGHFIFNLKTGTFAPWNQGTWTTTVSYKGIVLATTTFELRR